MARTLPSIGVMPWGETFDELAAVARAADGAGLASIWTAELHRSSMTQAAVIAQATSQATVGSAIAWAFARSPMLTALTALDLDEISDGRFILGLGAGVRRLVENWHNRPFDRPADRLRQTVAVIRAVMENAHLGEEIRAGGDLEAVTIKGYERPFPPVRPTVPIYLAGVGPRMTALAGEIADGWLGHELGSPEHLAAKVVPQLRAGLEQAGRARGSLDVVASACCVIHADSREAKRRAAPLVAFYATVRTYKDFFAFHGFGEEAAAVAAAFADGDEKAMIAACTDEMVAALTVCGTPDEVRARLEEYGEHVDAVKLSPPTHLVSTEVTREAMWAILEHLAA